MPCVEMPDSQRCCIRILCLIIQAVDGIQNVLWWAPVLIKATVARRSFLRMLKPCEQKSLRQKEKETISKAR